jgi:hypothetical protein
MFTETGVDHVMYADRGAASSEETDQAFSREYARTGMSGLPGSLNSVRLLMIVYAWCARFGQAARHLEDDLDHGRLPLPTCTAEEIALHLALDETEVVLDLATDSDQYARTVFGELPEHPRDYDWDLCHDAFFQDSDVLFLYDSAADGIEDPETDINQHFGIGDLRPARWFDTFLNMKPRHPAASPEEN